MEKRVKPRTVPWGTPDSTEHLEEEIPSRTTHCVRWWRNNEIQFFFKLPLMPYHSNFYNRCWYGRHFFYYSLLARLCNRFDMASWHWDDMAFTHWGIGATFTWWIFCIFRLDGLISEMLFMLFFAYTYWLNIPEYEAYWGIKLPFWNPDIEHL